MEKNKKIPTIVILVFIISLITVVGFKQSEDKKVDTNIDTNTNNEEQVEKEAEIITIEFDENTNLEEAESMIYEKYSNNNLRIVGAVIQEVNHDCIIVKTYRAGIGTESIVEEKKIKITNNTLFFETIVSFDQQEENSNNVPITTRETIVSLKPGDHVVIECADDKSTKDANEFTALIIIKDVSVFDELVEDEDVE